MNLLKTNQLSTKNGILNLSTTLHLKENHIHF